LLDGYLRTGRIPTPFAGKQPAPAPAEDWNLASDNAAALLGRMLNGEHEIVLGEWLELAAVRRRLVRPGLVPALLTKGERETDLQKSPPPNARHSLQSCVKD